MNGLIQNNPSFKPPMTKRVGGLGVKGGGCHPQQVFPIFLGNVKSLSANQIFSCRLILGTVDVYEKIFQIGPTVLALKLDKGRVLWGVATPH